MRDRRGKGRSREVRQTAKGGRAPKATAAHQLSHHTRSHPVGPSDELLAERALLGALPQTKQTDKDVLLGVFVREEGFPATCEGRKEGGE